MNNGDSPEATYLLTVSVTNTAGASDFVELEVVIYICNKLSASLTQPNFVYLLNSESQMTLTFNVNTDISAHCLMSDFSFTINGSDVSSYTWLAQN